MGHKQKGREEEEEDEDGDVDERREAAIASTQCLQPSFKPKHVTQTQLSKLQELHNRRLQIKSKKNKSKGTSADSVITLRIGVKHDLSKGTSDRTCRSHGIDLKDSDDKDSAMKLEGSNVSNMKSHVENSNISLQQNNVVTYGAPKKRQKLHWGLDTKERWERKANM